MKATLTLIAAMVAGLAITAADATPPPVTITLGSRQAHVTPQRHGFTHTGGGIIDVQQPAPDTVIVTMTGAAVAGAHPCKSSCATLNFDLEQCFEIGFDRSDVKAARLTLEGRVIGLLRSEKNGRGTAKEGPGAAAVIGGPSVVAALTTEQHDVGCGNNLSLNCKPASVSGMVGTGPFLLKQTWTVSASHPASLWPCKAASAEFAPEPALDPLWISYWEPFHGAQKKDFGFQVILRVVPDNIPSQAVRK